MTSAPHPARQHVGLGWGRWIGRLTGTAGWGFFLNIKLLGFR
jgi:hypothetical protein